MWLEGGGGGQKNESYGLMLYYLANYTSTDCFEKRGKKGYIFLIGDEMSHPISKEHIKQYIGVDVERDYTFDEVLVQIQEKYNVFYILPKLTSYYDDTEVNNFWKSRLGERFLKLEDPNAICELIATTIGLTEGNADIDQIDTDLTDEGTDENTKKAVRGTLAKLSGNTAISQKSLRGTGLTSV